MEIINVEESNGIKYYTIKVVNKFISTTKIIDLIENVEDYIDKKGVFDKELFKEDVLEMRNYLVTIKNNKATCTCKSALFNKKPCRHIKFVMGGN